MRLFALLIASIVVSACASQQEPTKKTASETILKVAVQPVVETASELVGEPEPLDPAHDYFSFANTDEFVTDRLRLKLTVDFERRELHGQALLHMRWLDFEAREIILDTRDLHIESVKVGDSHWAHPAEFRIAETHPVLGQALAITLPEILDIQENLVVIIRYRTDPKASALQWLPPELTAGGEHPFLFSQSQSIHARSWVPLQDTPSVKITYEATIHTPAGLLAVMSADNDPQTPRDGEYHFSMPQPIPSYLLAIAVGNIHFASIGERTGVYAEPELLDASRFEFADTQQMLETAETMFGPYQWGRYDLLVLPPSFPFGGMENPRLSFITPSLLAGDRSLVSTIAHELAHSWSGNLVSNRTWRDIWLNEGITNYLDTRLMEVLFGADRADEERLLSYHELQKGLAEINPPMQALAPREHLDDPDESQGTLHYQKGMLFMQHLEDQFGREAFDAFMAAYFKHFEFQSISSEQFLDYLDQNLLQKHPGKFTRSQAGEWLYEPGLPGDAPAPRSKTLERAAGMAIAWAADEICVSEIPLADWSPRATVHFINSLPATLSTEQLTELDASFGFSQSRNAEISRAWFTQVATRRHLPAYGPMRHFLERYGRLHLIYPVYMALVDNGEDTALAAEIFGDSRHRYHPITVSAIESHFDSLKAY